MPFQLRFDNHRNKATLFIVRCLGLFYGGFFLSVKALVTQMKKKNMQRQIKCVKD